MRYAIVSDLHSNWQAWSAVREDIFTQEVDAIICLGDIVGYGPSPARVLADLRQHCDNFILGNHDAAIVGRLDLDIFNDTARRAAEWTTRQLDENAKQFFREMPVVVEDEHCLFVHAETVAPEHYGYVEQPGDALVCLQATDKQCVFLGHTHRAAIFVLPPAGELVFAETTEVAIVDGARYLVNVGSVGDPRDGTDQASYCICDLTAGRIALRKVPFDCQAFLRELKKFPELGMPWFLRQSGDSRLRLARDNAMTPTEISKSAARPTSRSAHLKLGSHLPRRQTEIKWSSVTKTAAVPAPAQPQEEKVWINLDTRGATPEAPTAPGTPSRRQKLAVLLAALLLLIGGAALVVWYWQIRSAPTTPVPAVAAVVPVADPRQAIVLPAADAILTGSGIRREEIGGVTNIGYWIRSTDFVTWLLPAQAKGPYAVELTYALEAGLDGNGFVLVCGAARLAGKLKATGTWSNFTVTSVGTIAVPAGTANLELRSTPPLRSGVMNLRSLTLQPLPAGSEPPAVPPVTNAPTATGALWFATASSQGNNNTAGAVNDGREPKNSSDNSLPHLGWERRYGTTEWVECSFYRPSTVSAVSVYWYDDSARRGRCRVPRSWEVFYKVGREWKPVAATSASGTQKDTYNRVTFSPVSTTALRIVVKQATKATAGILELKIE